MLNRAARNTGRHEWRKWPTLSIVGAGAALFLALGGSAVAATNLIHARDIAAGAVTSQAIKNEIAKVLNETLTPEQLAKYQLEGAQRTTAYPEHLAQWIHYGEDPKARPTDCRGISGYLLVGFTKPIYR